MLSRWRPATTDSASSAASRRSLARQSCAQGRVGRHGPRHRGGRASPHAPGQGQALLDRELEADGGRGALARAPTRPRWPRCCGRRPGGCAGRTRRRHAPARRPAGHRRDRRRHPVALAREGDAQAVEARAPGWRWSRARKRSRGRRRTRRGAAHPTLRPPAASGEHRVVLEGGRVSERLLAGGDVAEQPPHDLPAAGLGQGLGEADLVGTRDGPDLPGHVLLELGAQHLVGLVGRPARSRRPRGPGP